MNRFGPLLFLVFCAAALFGREPSRFKRLVKQYTNVCTMREDRYLEIDIARLVYPGPRVVDSIWLDTTFRFDKSIGAGLTFLTDQKITGEKLDIEKATRVALGAAYRAGGFARRGYVEPSSNCSLGVCLSSGLGAAEDSDTVVTTIALSGSHRRVFTKYLRAAYPLAPSLALDAGVEVTGGFEHEENTEPYFDPSLPEAFVRHKYHLRTQRADAVLELVPGAALGRPINTTHLSLALEIEKELKKSGTIRFDLSDKTLLAIAKLVSENDSYKLHDHEEFKKFKAKLDTLIVADAAGDADKLRFFSQFQIRHLVLRKAPEFLSGPTVGLFTQQHFSGQLRHFAKEYPYDSSHVYNDTSSIDFEPGYGGTLDIKASWGVPISPRWFFDVACMKRFVSERGGWEFADDGRFEPEKLAQADWGLTSLFWIHVRLFAEIGVEHLLAHVVVPKEWPYHSWCALDVLIEENFSVRAQFSIYNSQMADKSYVSPFGAKLRQGFVAAASAVYSF